VSRAALRRAEETFLATGDCWSIVCGHGEQLNDAYGGTPTAAPRRVLPRTRSHSFHPVALDQLRHFDIVRDEARELGGRAASTSMPCAFNASRICGCCSASLDTLARVSTISAPFRPALADRSDADVETVSLPSPWSEHQAGSPCVRLADGQRGQLPSDIGRERAATLNIRLMRPVSRSSPPGWRRPDRHRDDVGAPSC